MRAISAAVARSAGWIRQATGLSTVAFVAGIAAVPVLVVPAVIAFSREVP